MDTGTHRLKFKELFRLSLRSFRLKPVRAFLTILGMSVGIGAVLFLVSLGYGLQYILIGELVTTEDSLVTMEISYPSESSLLITKDEVTHLRDVSHVAEVSPIAEFPAEMRSASTSGYINVRVIEPSYFRLSGISPDVGKPLGEAEPETILNTQTLSLMNIKNAEEALGQKFDFTVFFEDTLALSNTESQSRGPLEVRGVIADEASPPTALLLARHLAEAPTVFRSVLVKADTIENVAALQDELITRGFLVSARIDLVNQARKITNAITIILGVFGITALIVSAIGMFNTMIVGFMERIYEVGILKSIGATDADVRNLFLMESSIMGLLGGVGGIVLGVGGGKAMNTLLSVIAEKLGGKAFNLFITPLWFLALIVILSLAIGLFSGFWPARRASHLSPKEAFVRK